MKRNFITNLSFLIFVNLLVKPFWILGVDRSVQNYLGPETYGIYFALFNFTFILNILLDLGITFYNNKKMASDPDAINSTFPLFLKIKVLLAVVYTGTAMFFGHLAGFDLLQIKILSILILNQALLSFIMFFRSFMGGLHFFRTEGIFSILDKLLMIILVGSMLWLPILHEFNLFHFLFGQTVALFLVATAGFIWVRRKAGPLKHQSELSVVKTAFKNTLPYATLVFMMSVYNRIDGFMIERLIAGDAGSLEAGIYAASYRLLDAAFMISFLFTTLLLPMFSRMLSKGEKVDALINTSARLLFFTAMSICLLSWFFRAEIMDILYWEADAYWANVFGMLMITFLFTSTNMIFSTVLTADNNLTYLNRLAFFGVTMNVLLNWFFIQEYAAMGAVYATLITQAFVCMMNLIVSIQKKLYRPNYKFFFQILLFTTFSFFAVITVSRYLNYDWKWQFIVCTVMIMVSSLISGLVQSSELKKFLKMLKEKV